MTGGAAPKRKGDEWERDVVAYLRHRGLDAHRAYGAGRPDDVGDLIVGEWGHLLVECKNCKAPERSEWLNAAHIKVEKWGPSDRKLIPIIVEKRARRLVGSAYVTIELDGLVDLIREVARQVAFLDERDTIT